jgi:hypothetical protein
MESTFRGLEAVAFEQRVRNQLGFCQRPVRSYPAWSAVDLQENRESIIKNQEYALAWNFMHYDFCNIHSTRRITTVMAGGMSKTVWEIEDLLTLID